MITRFPFLFALAAMLAGCTTLDVLFGSIPTNEASAEKLSAVKTIAVIRPPEPRYVDVSFTGGGIPSKEDQYKIPMSLTRAIKAQGVLFMSDLADQIAAKLQAAGFDAKVEDAPWGEGEERELGYPYYVPVEKIDSTADAVLVVSVVDFGFHFVGPTFGFITGSTPEYIPTLEAIVALLAKDQKKELYYRGHRSGGYGGRGFGTRSIPPTTTFSNFDAMMSDPKACAVALSKAVSAVAESVAADLRF